MYLWTNYKWRGWYHLLQAEKTANIVQLTSYPLYFEKLFVASAGTTNLARGGGGGGGGGYSDNFIHMKAWTIFFLVQYFEFQYFWWFSKNEDVLGHEDFVDI